jgi:hypothetical protein
VRPREKARQRFSRTANSGFPVVRDTWRTRGCCQVWVVLRSSYASLVEMPLMIILVIMPKRYYEATIDLAFFGSSRVRVKLQKISVISGRKKSCQWPSHSTHRASIFGSGSGGSGLGRDTRTFYSVKQLKTAFRAGLRPKKIFAGFKISAHARPVRFVGEHGTGRAYRPGRAGLKMLRYKLQQKVCEKSYNRRVHVLHA